MLRVNWMEGYDNLPSLEVKNHNRSTIWPITERRYRKIPCINGGFLYLATHPDGYADFYYHSGRPANDGGFGGSTFCITLIDGTRKLLMGPWSNRATAINYYLPSIDHLIDTRSGAFTLTAILTMMKAQAFPYYMIRVVTSIQEEQIRPMISTHPNEIRKPSGKICQLQTPFGFEILYEPNQG